MTTMHIDVETYSDVDLAKTGPYRYVDDPSFVLLLVSWAIDDEPVQTWQYDDGPLPAWFVGLLCDPDVTKVAHNAAFEIAVLDKATGQRLDVGQWQCTRVWGAELSYPRSLDKMSKYLGTVQKGAEGAQLISYFCKPATSGVLNGRRREAADHPELWAKFIEYNRSDVEAERAIYNRLVRHPLPQSEWDMWHADQRINRRGIRVDTDLARQAVAVDHAQTEERHQQMRALTGLDNPNSNDQLSAWLSKHGVDLPNLRKETITAFISESDEEHLTCRSVLGLRLANSSKSTTKYHAMLRSVCGDGRVKGQHQFYGADTGRWAGRLVQIQNLPRPEASVSELDVLRMRLADGDTWLRSDQLKDLVRTAFIPGPGKEFIVADFASIEARVLAWLAGEQWVLEAVRGHGLIYEATAAAMLHKDITEITKADRTKGKIATLALGYQGAAGALVRMGALDMGLTKDELPGIVEQWRSSRPRTVHLWSVLEKAAARAGEHYVRVGRLRVSSRMGPRGRDLVIGLPSGRDLRYSDWRYYDARGRTRCSYLDTTTMTRVDTYGGKLVENVTQAVARDVLGEALVSLDMLGYDVVAHVHDEVIVEAPLGSVSVGDVVGVMAAVPWWASGLPLAADGFTAEYYRKG